MELQGMGTFKVTFIQLVQVTTIIREINLIIPLQASTGININRYTQLELIILQPQILQIYLAVSRIKMMVILNKLQEYLQGLVGKVHIRN